MPAYKYYGLFEPDQEGNVNVSFPDLPGCLTFGEDFKEALDMAEDALGGFLLVSEIENDPIPTPSAISELDIPNGISVILIEVNTDNLSTSE